MAMRNRIFGVTLFLFTIVVLFFSATGFAAENKVIAYYFHGSARCFTCKRLEQYTKEATEANFKDEIKKGVLEFKPVNVDEKANKHFVNNYKLYTKSLIISKVEDGKEIQHKNLEKIWEYVRSKDKFFDYVASEIRAYLEE